MTYEVTMPIFEKINVIEVKTGIPRNDYQKFICSGHRLADLIEHHLKDIELAIIYSEKNSFYDGLVPIYCMSGFIERYARMPTFDDKIQIVADKYLDVLQRGSMYYVTSELDFNVL